jgi:hypothetical protein
MAHPNLGLLGYERRPHPGDAYAVRLQAVWRPIPPTPPPRGLLPNMSDKLRNPGSTGGSGFSILRRSISPSESSSRLIHIATMKK